MPSRRLQDGAQGKAGLALAVAAIGSFIAGTIATFIIAFFAPPLAELALSFGAAENPPASEKLVNLSGRMVVEAGSRADSERLCRYWSVTSASGAGRRIRPAADGVLCRPPQI